MKRIFIAATLALSLLRVPTVYAQSEEVLIVIHHVAHVYGLPVERMLCIAQRESTFRPWVTSPANHRGMWQFSDGTWQWASRMAGVDGSPYDLVASTYAAGWLLSQPGGASHWSVARYC